MAATDYFRKRHAEIVDIVKQIEAALVPQNVSTNAASVKSLLSSLMGKLDRP